MSDLNLPVQAQVKPHPPIPTVLLDTFSYFYCDVPNASIHRPDGKRIAFLFGVCKTNNKGDIEFLTREINDLHPNITMASAAQVKDYEYRMDPRGTVRAEVTQELEQDLRTKILAELARDGKLIAGVDIGDIKKVDRAATELANERPAMVETPLMPAAKPALGGIVGTDRAPNGVQSTVTK